MPQLPPPPESAHDTTVDLLVIGSGTGMAAALTAHEEGLSTLIVEKTPWVGGSMARSGGAFWVPDNPILKSEGAVDSLDRAGEYVHAVVGSSAPADRGTSFLEHGTGAVQMLQRTTPLNLFWSKGYSDYHAEEPGGNAVGRTCESRPFNAMLLGTERARLRPGQMASPLPMPITGTDYRWMNLMARKPGKALPRIFQRLAQGIGGKMLRREYVAGGQALAAGLYAGILRSRIPLWTETALVQLISDGDRVTGAVVTQNGHEYTISARRGIVLAAGGFDHDMDMRRRYQSGTLGENESMGAEGNTGDAIKAAQEVGADIGLMDQAWWFPAVAPTPGNAPMVMLAERSLPGSFIVDQTGHRFINEAKDYMSFGQRLLQREKAGDPVESMWIIFDQEYRDSYVFAGSLFPRMAIPKSWYEHGLAHSAESPVELAQKVGLPSEAFTEAFDRFNVSAAAGNDGDFGRGRGAYDRYYGDPTVTPNPNLRPLNHGPYHAVRMTLSDLGTCGGVVADDRGRALRADGRTIDGLYAIGNTAGNAFGHSYPGAGATIGQGIVYGYIAARDAARVIQRRRRA